MRARNHLRRAACVAMLGAAAFVGAATAAAPRGASVAVSLAVDESAPQAGDAVQVTATVRRLPHGDLVVIRAIDSQGIADTVATCRTAICNGYWTEADPATVRFQAFVRTRPKGGRIAGRSTVVELSWSAAPPPPPPPPTVLDGHYCGLTNEGKSICFDVVGDAGSGQQVANLRIESRMTCGDGSGWWWWLYPPGALTIDPATLRFSFSGTWNVNATTQTNAVATYAISGTFDSAGHVSGTAYLSHMSWNENGTHYECAGDPRTWTARLGA